jgi:hypothetical protein
LPNHTIGFKRDVNNDYEYGRQVCAIVGVRRACVVGTNNQLLGEYIMAKKAAKKPAKKAAKKKSAKKKI